MGKGQESCEVINYEEIIFLLLNIAASIQPLLAEENLQMRHGIVLFAEELDVYEAIIDFCKNAGAVIWNNLSSKNRVRNDKIALHAYQLYDKRDMLDVFLENENFTPAVVVRGVIPDDLKEKNILPFTSADMEKALIYFKKYKMQMCKNPDVICKELRKFKTSDIYLSCTCKYSIYTAFEAAAYVFGSFYREDHSEEQTRIKYTQLRASISYAAEMAERNSGDYEVSDVVRKAIENYLDGHLEINICRVDEVDGKAQEALEIGNLILYDEAWYYVPEIILSNACSEVRKVVSMPKIKKELQKEGFLWCNDTAQRNFTVKKQLVNIFGGVVRKHFLKIHRCFFETLGSLSLEERRKEPV